MKRRRKAGALTSGGNLLTGGRNANDNALPPALVTRLQGSPHHRDIASAVEGVVASPVRHLNELLLNVHLPELRRVHEMGGSELLSPALLIIVQVNRNNHVGLLLHSTLDNRQTDAAHTKYRNVRAGFNLSCRCCRTISRSDTTAK